MGNPYASVQALRTEVDELSASRARLRAHLNLGLELRRREEQSDSGNIVNWPSYWAEALALVEGEGT